MRQLAFALFLVMVFPFASAVDRPVPGDTLLSNLPTNSRIRVDVDMSSTYMEQVGPQVFHRSGVLEAGAKIFTERKGNHSAGEELAIVDISLQKDPSLIGGQILRIQFTSDRAGSGYMSLDRGAQLTTVEDFNKRLRGHFEIIYDDPNYDPYPGLEKNAVVDIVMVKITNALKTSKYAVALPHFAYLEKLGTPLPESFHYYYIEALEKTGKKDQARARAMNYLKNYGRKGKYYGQVVETMGRL